MEMANNTQQRQAYKILGENQNFVLSTKIFPHSTVLDLGPVIVVFEAVCCCISMGDIGVRLFCCFVGGGGVVSNGDTL